MTGLAIWRASDPRAAHWQLGAPVPENLPFTVLGWSSQPPPVDAGVPPDIAGLFARAMASCARVTFASSSLNGPLGAEWTATGGVLACRLVAGSVAGRLRTRLKNGPGTLTLVATRQPETIARLFDDAAFPWWMQGQFVILSLPDAPPPRLDWEATRPLLGDAWAVHAAALSDHGVAMVCRPGVDGDVMGLLGLSPIMDETLLDAIRREAETVGVAWLEQQS